MSWKFFEKLFEALFLYVYAKKNTNIKNKIFNPNIKIFRIH